MAGPKDRDPYAGIRSAGLLLAIPGLLIVSPLVGFFIGSWFDHRFHTSPWLVIVGLVLGFVTAGRETIRLYRRYLAEEEERQKRPRS
jgi:F0F1-type ATP synthase assembly protein I